MRKNSSIVAILFLLSFVLMGPVAVAQIDLPDFSGGLNEGGMLGNSAENENQVLLKAEFTEAKDGQPARLFLTATIAEGWHTYSITQADNGPGRTKIEVTPSPHFKLIGDFQSYPKPKVESQPIAFPGIDIEIHEGKVTWYAPLEIAPGVDLASLKITGKVTVFLCLADSCQPPKTYPFNAVLGKGEDIPIESKDARTISTPKSSGADPSSATAPISIEKSKNVDDEPKGKSSPKRESDSKKTEGDKQSTEDDASLWIQLALAFLGGVILNVMPCVLPVISLKLLTFMKQAGESRLRVFSLNLWYTAGLLSVFVVLAALASSMGLAWGEQFSYSWFKVAMTGLVFVMALSFLGVWEIPIPGFVGSGHVVELQQKEGPSGAFFKGVFTTIMATPCSGPFLGPVFGYLLGKPPHVIYMVFLAVGLGLASPYLIIGAFPTLMRFLPKPGSWMKTFEELMGFFLLGTMVYLLYTMPSSYFIPTIMLLGGLWFACWLIGRLPMTVSPFKRLLAWVSGLVVAASVGCFAFLYLLGISEVKYSEADSVVTQSEDGRLEIRWRKFSLDALAQARAEGKTVVVDFWAKWCLTCQMNSKLAIETQEVAKLIQSNKVVPMLADWSDRSLLIKQALADLNHNSIPLLVIWPASSPGSEKSPIILNDRVSESQVLDALKQAGPSHQ